MPIFKPDEFLLNILPKKRLLGIDHGTKILGIAISNSDMTVASPIKTIKRDKLTSDLNKLISIWALILLIEINVKHTKIDVIFELFKISLKFYKFWRVISVFF